MADRRRFANFRFGQIILPAVTVILLGLFSYSFSAAQTHASDQSPGDRRHALSSLAVNRDAEKVDSPGARAMLSLGDQIYRLSQHPDVRLFLDQIVEVERAKQVNYPR